MKCRHQINRMLAIALVCAALTPVHAQMLNDPLQGSTIGTRSGGTFVAGGWRVDNQYDSIFWHVPNVNHGAFEYDVVGLGTNCPGIFGSKNEISHMYDYTFNNADNQYAPGYQGDPFKQYIRKQCDPGKENKMEILWQILPNLFEDDSAPLSWDAASTYRWRCEWLNAGGNAYMYTYRNGALVWAQVLPGSWTPGGLSVRIAASTRRADEGAHVGAVYSNVKVWDVDNAVPGTPAVTVPANGETVNNKLVHVAWSGDSHSMYQVRINTANDPNSGTVWDSQQVTSSRNFTFTGTLNDLTTYFVFVRQGGAGGWSNWSANGRTFTVNTGFVPGGTNYVAVKGNSHANFSGPFLGLGFSHFRGLQRCKFDRTRYQNDLAFMASKGFNYQRILSMVAWQGVEIAPVSFGSVPAWSDYDQQLKDCIDIAYDTYGIRTELTIFADAQIVMNNDSTRIAHLDRILNDLVGREHKVVLLEVANEYWQNGFPDPAGFNDVESKARYLAVRTPIPVALSSPGDTSDFGVASAHSGSAGDISTVHLSRDTGTIEGNWLPVHDSYRNVLGIPPMSSNEPIGPGSSVAQETDPIKLCMAAVVAYVSNCPSYVYHCKAGIQGWTNCCPPSGTEKFFSSSEGVDSYQNILPLLPKDLASWERDDGKAAAAPFTSFASGQANKYWPDLGGGGDGCVRNISAIKSGRFVAAPIGILGGGLQLQARRPMTFKVYNPLTGSVDYNLSKNANDVFTIAQGPGAYVIIGDFTDVPLDGGGTSLVSIDLGTTDVSNGMTHVICCDGMTTPATIGGRNCRQNVSQTADRYFYFGVSDGFAFNGSKPDVYVSIDYYDTGTGTFVLTYDGATGAYVDASTTVTLTNSNTWKTFTWHITNAYFGNRENGGADFRIFRSVATTFYLDRVSVFVSAFGGSPASLPGTIQAENYDNGGEGVAYHDTDTTNNGGQYRLGEGVDVETTADTGGGFNVGFIITGEYLSYQVNVAAAGNYDIGMRVASGTSTGTYHIEVNGVNVTGTRTVTSTGGYQTWATQTIPNIALSAGVQTLKVVVEFGNGNWNFNYITVTPFQGPFGGTARAIPGVIQAEDFDIGGPGIAYNDTDPTNNGGQYRTTEQVDIEATTDTGGGYNVGWTSPGEWLEYTVNVATTGDYLIKMRVATADAGGTFHLSLNGANITSTEGGATTAGWQTWTTISIPGIFITAGNNQVLRLTTDSGDLNINWIEFVFGGSDVVSEDLDIVNSDDGMTHPNCCDGNTVPWTIGGHYCRNNATVPDHYFYFGVTDIYAFQGNKNNVTITFDYFDKDTGTLTLNYDGASSPYTTGPSVTLTNSLTWKTAVWQIGDAYFGNRENGAADFRIFYSGIDFYIDTVMVFATTGPGQATNPNPANAATLVPITSTLSWTAGSGATSHDVRFGTANPPPFIINQAGTTYNPGTLAANTTYFWRIDEKNAVGTTTGVVWSFTTLPLPGAASSPSPANAATLVPITSTLSWTAGSNAASHDVRFGTANPPPFVINQAGTTYNPGTLAANTTYFWRIDEKNTSGTTTGTVWSFTTLPLPGAASAPNPANAATGVSIATSVSWTAGSNAASHDVRFGTANPPPFVINQAGTTYNPGTLAAGTTYFWRIDEKNTSGTTTGTVWSFTTLPLPGLASAPSPANAATGVSITATVSWTAGSNTTSHDVRFGTANPPPFVVNQAGATYNPGTLANNTTYFWRIDEKNGSGTTTGTVWSFTTVASGPPVINVKVAGNMTIDGSSSDWNISQFVTKVRGGEHLTGDYGIVGVDGGFLYYAGYWTGGVLPTSAADHTAKIYCLHDSVYLYILARLDDSSIQTQNAVGSNWANDCMEIYIDPGNAGGSTAISNSTSDIQLVIDALNQKNVFMCTAGYTTQVLNGITSTVTTDASGWWLEARIQKSALSPVIPNSGQIGIEFNLRDNDNNNDPTLTTVYDWADPTSGAGFPSKIPNNWGKTSLAALPAAPGAATSPSPANAATGVSVTPTLSWTAGSGALSHDVRFGTVNPPPFVINKTGATYAPSTLANNTTYFWRIDEKNAGGTTTGTVWSFATLPSGPVTISNSTFASSADGWNILTWRSGPNGFGTMAFEGGTGNPAGDMLCGGSGATNNNDNCTREGGEINKTISTSGYNTLVQVQYDLRFNTDQTGTSCNGGCPSGILQGDCADKLVVYYSTAGTGGPWTLLEQVYASSVTQNVWTTRTINCPVAANNKPNFALRFIFQVNTVDVDLARLDNIKVIATP